MYPGTQAINHGTDDLLINPADFVARDDEHRVWASDPVAALSDGNLVRLTAGFDVLPMPTIILRQSDVLCSTICWCVRCHGPSGSWADLG
jgi:hypothetical protein